jgi:hypothetical protein
MLHRKQLQCIGAESPHWERVMLCAERAFVKEEIESNNLVHTRSLQLQANAESPQIRGGKRFLRTRGKRMHGDLPHNSPQQQLRKQGT